MLQVYTSSGDMFSKSRMFDNTARNGPKVLALLLLPQLSSLQLVGNVLIRISQAIVSEYAVTGSDAGRGTLIAALAEAAFLIGLERNRFVFNSLSGLAPA
jgi:alpha-N-arabinofuranosidase